VATTLRYAQQWSSSLLKTNIRSDELLSTPFIAPFLQSNPYPCSQYQCDHLYNTLFQSIQVISPWVDLSQRCFGGLQSRIEQLLCEYLSDRRKLPRNFSSLTPLSNSEIYFHHSTFWHIIFRLSWTYVTVTSQQITLNPSELDQAIICFRVDMWKFANIADSFLFLPSLKIFTQFCIPNSETF